ncbi:hypothetical protein Agabi119p4_5211 [Agaricus bisporus var. burnettii]|uniref:Uncharacterized protein n=1 Tax=Agaricus bisporus var. burnettii TaxID=192524 RepID=A0A8H7F4S6_AGABI|nr:hypothetical protein Agabi119p4_5211 [Agaricus bisporus var. burnettii]
MDLTSSAAQTDKGSESLKLESSSEKPLSLTTSIASDIIPDSTLNGWIFFLRDLPEKSIMGDPALVRGSPRSELILATLLARRYLIRQDERDYEEARSMGEQATYLEEEDHLVCQYASEMHQASLLRNSLLNSQEWAMAAPRLLLRPGGTPVETPGASIYGSNELCSNISQLRNIELAFRNTGTGLPLSPSVSFTQILYDLLDIFPWKHMGSAAENPHVFVSVAEGGALVSIVKSLPESLHCSPDLHDYVCGCLVLAYGHYILYRQSGNRDSFDEALEYSSTASYLLDALGRPLSPLGNCQEWKLAYGISRNYAFHLFEDFTSLAQTWAVFELFDLFRSSMAVSGLFSTDPLAEIMCWYTSSDYSTTFQTYIFLATQPSIKKQVDAIGKRLATSPPLPLADFAMIHVVLLQFNSRSFDIGDAGRMIDVAVKERVASEPDDTSECLLALEILARMYVVHCTFFRWDSRAKESELFAEKYFRELISNSRDPTQSALLGFDFVQSFCIPRFLANGSSNLVEALALLSTAVRGIDETNRLFSSVALLLAQTHMRSLVGTHQQKHLTESISWYQKYADVAGPRAGLTPSLHHTNLIGSRQLGWILPLYIGLLHTISWARQALQQGQSECLKVFRVLSLLASNPLWLENTTEEKQLPLRTSRSIGSSAVAAVLKFNPEFSNVVVEYLEQNLSITYRHLLQLSPKQGVIDPLGDV